MNGRVSKYVNSTSTTPNSETSQNRATNDPKWLYGNQPEPQKKTTHFRQCHRYQNFGHNQAICTQISKLVKYGQTHLTEVCDIPKNKESKCGNCSGRHLVIYGGCSIFPLANNRQKLGLFNSHGANKFEYTASNINKKQTEGNNIVDDYIPSIKLDDSIEMKERLKT